MFTRMIAIFFPLLGFTAAFFVFVDRTALADGMSGYWYENTWCAGNCTSQATGSCSVGTCFPWGVFCNNAEQCHVWPLPPQTGLRCACIYSSP
jgi:hypothetical protein